MSHHLYLECLTHEPKISSSEVGSHLSDLPEIREHLSKKEDYLKIFDIGIDWWELNFDDTYKSTAVHFMLNHPKCEIAIIDEYGKYWETALDTNDDEVLTYISWTDDAVVLMCEREQCMVEDTSHAGHARKVWFIQDIPYKAQPEDITRAFNAHIRTHK